MRTNIQFVVLFSIILQCFSVPIPLTSDSAETRARTLVGKMTMDEKLTLVAGRPNHSPYAGSTSAIPRLNIPQFNLQDGPQGVGDDLKQVTFFPCTLATVSTWDLNLMYQYTEAIGWEQRKKSINIHLGPMVNIARIPTGGRNFESFGEDPFLSSQMVVPYVKGIQSNSIMATVKHFVDNNQEYNRTTTSANVPQRAQFEIYYPAFKAAIDAGVASVMCSYNRINDTWACENDQTLNKDLKGKMGFKGYVMSDWGATHSTVLAANSGLDQQMPDDSFFGQKLKEAVQKGLVPQSRVDDMAIRILTAAYSVGIMDIPQPTGNPNDSARNASHDQLARKIATESIVLAKNKNNALPLTHKITKIALIGDDATKPLAGGDGSGHVIPPYIISPLKGITERAGNSVKVNHAGSSDVAAAAKLASSADVAIVFVSVRSTEGRDRPTLSLGNNNNHLVSSVAKAQKNTIVVTFSPGAVLMPWIDEVSSVLVSTYPGQELGHAIASVLFGDHNPSAKFPVTFPVGDKQVPAQQAKNYPGINNEAAYSEELQVGYRWFDSAGQTPLFPFGHGLSYTVFSYGNLSYTFPSSEFVQFEFDLYNNGSRAGAEVAQLYIGFPSEAGEPPKNLKGFQKVQLNKGHRSHLTFQVSRTEFRTWSVFTNDWEDRKGTFTVFVGSSSRDIRIQTQFII